MDQIVSFTKTSGAGNDFVLIDNMNEKIQGDKAKLAIALCSRHFGVGADGLILLEPSSKADFLMRYYNADGSYGGMCGNGGRCAARFALLGGIAEPSMTFEALDHIYRAEVVEHGVRLHMKDPSDFRTNLQVNARGVTYDFTSINTGSPHIVIFANKLEDTDVRTVGRALREHRSFSPEGANVNFVKVLGKRDLQIRTYERGVEAETMACGTGTVAAAIVSYLLRHTKPPITVRVTSGEHVTVDFEFEGDTITHVVLEGSAHMLFSGQALYDMENQRSRTIAAPIPAPFTPLS